MHKVVTTHVAGLSMQSPVLPAQPVTPQQQHGGSHGPDQLVTNVKESKEQYEEKQPVEATDSGRGGVHGESHCNW